jgi:hypothetical protein
VQILIDVDTPDPAVVADWFVQHTVVNGDIDLLPSTWVNPAPGEVNTGLYGSLFKSAVGVNSCAEPGCTKGVVGRGDRCTAHGGAKRCAEPGCTKGDVYKIESKTAARRPSNFR